MDSKKFSVRVKGLGVILWIRADYKKFLVARLGNQRKKSISYFPMTVQPGGSDGSDTMKTDLKEFTG